MPTIGEVLHDAKTLLSEGHVDIAVNYCQQILRAAPNNRDALLLLGDMCLRQEKLECATEYYQKLLEISPNLPHVHNNLGVALVGLKRHVEAREHFETTLRLQGDNIDARVNLARSLVAQGHIAPATEHLKLALQLDPTHLNAHLHLAHVNTQLGNFVPAAQHYEHVLRKHPEHAVSHWNLAMARLALGDFERGWREFSWRWKCEEFASFRPSFCGPAWEGQSLSNRRILLWTEQGIGDTFQFIRYASVLQRLAAKVLFRCPISLIPLMSRCEGIDVLIADDMQPQEYDFHASLFDLPRILGTTVDTVPVPVPYMSADPLLVQYWQKEIEASSKFKIGIVWQGSQSYTLDTYRSFQLAEFEPIAKIPHVQLFSLQRALGTEQLPTIAQQFSVVDLGSRIDDDTAAFAGTAAALSCLDLVIACDTAVGHLAGAMGVPVWLALSTAADWRWMLDRCDSPWYPRTRLFRQSHLNAWKPVFQLMADTLYNHLQSAASQKQPWNLREII